jgi:hypothetical protein
MSCTDIGLFFAKPINGVYTDVLGGGAGGELFFTVRDFQTYKKKITTNLNLTSVVLDVWALSSTVISIFEKFKLNSCSRL